MLSWPCIIGIEGEHLGLSALWLLGLCTLNAGSQGLQPEVAGLFQLEVCLGLSLGGIWLGSMSLGQGYLYLLPGLSFVSSWLAVSFQGARGLSKAPLLGFLQEPGRSATRIDWRSEVDPACPSWFFLVSVQRIAVRATQEGAILAAVRLA